MPRFGVNHESGDLKRVLVHHPGKELELANRDPATHHFDCAVNVKQFQNDHQKLIDALKEANVEVLEVNTLLQDNLEMRKRIQEAPNLVFTRDSSTVTSSGAILFRMGLASRRKETPVIKAAHEAAGTPIAHELKEPETFEGGGFALLEGRIAVAGFCDRTTQGALDDLSKYLLQNRVVDTFIQLNMPSGAIHIDGEFAELPGKRAIVHSIALTNPAYFKTRTETWTDSFLGWLKKDGYDLIEITDQECLDMAANFLTVHRDLCIHYTGNPRVMKEVHERGIDVIQIPGDEMKRGCGGIHCMTCPVLRI
jgi:N-dimethylarginine dimethylaminohydrolase